MAYNYTPIIKQLLERHGLEKDGEIKFCVDRICKSIKGKDCVDNFRISVNGANDEIYNDQHENGCCGFHDDTIELNSGTIVKFGFNYGH